MREKKIDEANQIKQRVVEINNKLVDIEKEEEELSPSLQATATHAQESEIKNATSNFFIKTP